MTNSGILVALSVGSKRQLTDQWDNLARLGIVHLVVISGLHIGLVAALCTWLGSGLSRLLLLQGRLQVGRWLPSVLGFSGAGYYSLLAGFSLPSQRALIAVAVVMLARLLYRRINPVSCLIWALLLIAIDQPLAVLGAGFWLSFLAVALLLLWFLPWHPKSSQVDFQVYCRCTVCAYGGTAGAELAVYGQGFLACSHGQYYCSALDISGYGAALCVG
jgi:competence protein ComEC